jgi:AcrR family transcriptional regulator
MGKASETRLTILQKAFELIYINGYQATSVDEILATTKVTKGAFYYHFKNKEEMGLAVINEIMQQTMGKMLLEPLATSPEPLQEIYEMMEYLLIQEPHLQIKYGCPTNNLIQEMSPLNETFSQALAQIMNEALEASKNAVERAKSLGQVRAEVNSFQVAVFLSSGYAGIRNLGKLYQEPHYYHLYLKELQAYLNSLK